MYATVDFIFNFTDLESVGVAGAWAAEGAVGLVGAREAWTFLVSCPLEGSGKGMRGHVVRELTRDPRPT